MWESTSMPSRPLRLWIISLSASIASLALAAPSQAAGALPVSGKANVGTEAILEGVFSLTAHPSEGTSKKLPLAIVKELLSIGLSESFGKKELHGTKSSHSANVDFSFPEDGGKASWTLRPVAKIIPNCKPNDGGCTEVIAATTAKFSYGGALQGEQTESVTINKDGRVVPTPPGKKDPIITLYLDEQAFFSADIFATTPSALGLEPALRADFSFGTLAPGYDLTLFHGGFGCSLATCASDASFLNSLQSIVSTGPGGNWSFDQVLQVFTANNSIALPDFVYTNSIAKEATGTFGVSTEGSDAPGTEAAPGPLPILGVSVVFGYSRMLRKRIKSSKPEVIPII